MVPINLKLHPKLFVAKIDLLVNEYWPYGQKYWAATLLKEYINRGEDGTIDQMKKMGGWIILFLSDLQQSQY